jgi:hypothetical protein
VLKIEFTAGIEDKQMHRPMHKTRIAMTFAAERRTDNPVVLIDQIEELLHHRGLN